MMGGSMNINALASKINEINPQEILSKFGYSKEETSTILKGDMSPILEKNNQDQLLDYDVILDSYGSLFNDNLIRYFFKKAKEHSGFTKDEMKTYFEAYNNWFDFIFKIGSNFIYRVDEELQDCSILIKMNDDVFQMSKFKNINAIIYVKDYQMSSNK